jgi:sugar fermentation stimulation protein A
VGWDHAYARPLEEAILVRRYKRFLADVQRADGRVLTVHCPNPGSMLGCAEEGLPVRIQDSGNPKRKLRFTWEQVRVGRAWVGVNTMIPNRAVAAALAQRSLGSLAGHDTVQREVEDGGGSRIDLRLEGAGRPCWVEIKNTTLRVGREGRFPDSVTKRGLKHLGALTELVRKGDRAVQLFVVSRGDVQAFRPAYEIDPEYAAGLAAAHAAGVEVMAVRAKIGLRGVSLGSLLPVELTPGTP